MSWSNRAWRKHLLLSAQAKSYNSSTEHEWRTYLLSDGRVVILHPEGEVRATTMSEQGYYSLAFSHELGKGLILAGFYDLGQPILREEKAA